jgi:hypothetical protein
MIMYRMQLGFLRMSDTDNDICMQPLERDDVANRNTKLVVPAWVCVGFGSILFSFCRNGTLISHPLAPEKRCTSFLRYDFINDLPKMTIYVVLGMFALFKMSFGVVPRMKVGTHSTYNRMTPFQQATTPTQLVFLRRLHTAADPSTTLRLQCY